MLNAVLTALHLLNIREEFFLLLLFFFFLNSRVCFVIWKILFFLWVDLSVKVAPQKITNTRGCCHRDPPQIGHWCCSKVNHLTTVSSFGRSLWSFSFLFFVPGFKHTQAGKKEKPVNLTEKKVHDLTVHDHSFTQTFVHGTMMALESVLLWCLSICFVFVFFGF